MSKALKNAATGIIAISLVAVMFALPTFIFGAMAIMGFTHGGWRLVARPNGQSSHFTNRLTMPIINDEH